MSDVQALQPTIFSAPPRVWERLVAGTKQAMRKSGFLNSLMFQWAYDYKLGYLKAGHHPRKVTCPSFTPVQCFALCSRSILGVPAVTQSLLGSTFSASTDENNSRTLLSMRTFLNAQHSL